jgi:hypothetical protein
MTPIPTVTDRSPFPATSLAIVLGVTALLVWRLLAATGIGRPAFAGTGAAVLLALSLWLVGWERWRAVGTFLASLLVAPVALGVVVAVGGTAALSPGGTLLETAARLLLVGSCMLAVFGAVASTRGAIDRERARTYSNVAGLTAGVPTFVALALLASTIANSPENTFFGVQQFGVEFLGQLLGILFDPVPGRTHLGVFCFLAGAATVGVGQALDSLPLTELAPDDGRDIPAAIERAGRRLFWGGLASLVLALLFVAVELTPAGQSTLAEYLPAAVYDALVALTGTPLLRLLLWRLLVVTLAVAAGAWLLRRTVRSSADRVATVLAPYAGGAVLTGAVLAVSEPLMERFTTAVADSSVGPLAEAALESVLSVSGPGVVLLSMTVVVCSATGMVAVTLWTVLGIGYVTNRTAGVAMAAAGLFVASASSVVAGAPALLLLAGLVGAIVVWDAGAFGQRLRTEVGTVADTRRTELVHVGGTAVVGCVGAALTVGLTGVAVGSVPVVPDIATAGILACLVALVALVTALR